MDRANLARRRQQIRQKEARTSVSKSNNIKNDTARTSVPADQAPSELQPPVAAAPRVQSSKRPARPSKQAGSGTLPVQNPAVTVRQILQRVEFGDVASYLQSTKKQELMDELLVVATYATQLKNKVDECREAAELEVHRQSAMYNEAASELVHREAEVQELQTLNGELQCRLRGADEEYKSLTRWIREQEDKWKASEKAQSDQTELIRGMTAVQNQREEQFQSVSEELEQAMSFAQELQTENASLAKRLEFQQQEASRLQNELAELRAVNQDTGWDLRLKCQEVVDVSCELDTLKSEVLGLQGEFQAEVVSRQAIALDRDKLLRQLESEQDKRRANQEIWDSKDHQMTQELRTLDFEVRQLKQSNSRLRNEADSERSQREKAESNALKLAEFIDESKAVTKGLQSDLRQLSAQIEEERGATVSKDKALQNAYRHLQTLQKCCRDEQAAKDEALSEINALNQRIKTLRRDHLALLHRVEAPPQAVERWVHQ